MLVYYLISLHDGKVDWNFFLLLSSLLPCGVMRMTSEGWVSERTAHGNGIHPVHIQKFPIKIASLSVSKGESWGFLGAFFWSICHSLCKRLRALTGFNFSESLPFEFCETVSMEQSLQVFVEMILLCVQCMTIVSFWMVPYL